VSYAGLAFEIHVGSHLNVM